jgi:UDP-hydrolysing UDP-N-acetyl-D-glucosamine 2-epimerase
LIVGGMHLSARHGLTVEDIRADGFTPDAELRWLDDEGDDDPGGAGGGRSGDATAGDRSADEQAAEALRTVGADLRAHTPDAVLLAGDRLETAAAAIAATVSRVPIAHLHGGEQTLGAFDDALRHAITKLSHLHLVSHEEHAARVIAMGEDPSLVHVVGAPGLDAATRPDLPSRADLESALGVPLAPPVVLVTVHPATLDPDPADAARAVVAAMDAVPATYVVTLPNADPGADDVRAALATAAAGPGRVAVEALGTRAYWGLMRIADVMLGNSSSGIVEAPAVNLPAVNVGDRQAGRRREANVVDAPADAAAVEAALRSALRPGARERLGGARPALVDGLAGARVADIIARWRPPVPPRKAPIEVRT